MKEGEIGRWGEREKLSSEKIEEQPIFNSLTPSLISSRC
jgi:hypothetical protein